MGEFELGSTDVHVWVVPLDDPDKRRRRALAHLAERRILASYLGAASDELEFERSPHGKPRLRDEPLRFNLSHSGGVGLLAVSRELEVGVDVQGPHRAASEPWFARRVCTAREREALGSSPAPSELLRLWARKEAVIKARGDLSYVSAGAVDVLDRKVAGGWLCLDLELADPPDHHAAVAVRDLPDVSVTLRRAWDVGTDAPVPGSD